MTTVLFVHGTGTREPQYGAVLSRIRAGLASSIAPADVRPCYWGGTCGSWLQAGGLSIPAGDSARGVDGSPMPDDEVTLWGLLERDPLFELRLFRSDETAEELPPGAVVPGRDVLAAARSLAHDEELTEALFGAGLAEAFPDAVTAVLDSEPGRLALMLTSAAGGEVRAALARAFVAEAMARADDRFDGISPIDGNHRDQVLRILLDRLAASDRGIGGALTRAGLTLALSLGASKPMERRREAITRAATPFAGDIMVYLARGERIRAHIEAVVNEIDGPVVLLAHSLGGIASVDLLASRPMSNVVALVTVGSQVPYLYELGALPSLDFGAPLPSYFPRRWINVYDRRDLLSYAAQGVFGGRVTDEQIDNRAPFPRSHSAYFANTAFYDLLANVLKASDA